MVKKAVKITKRLFRFTMMVFKKSTKDLAMAFAAQSAFFFIMSAFPFAMLLLSMMRFAPISQETLLFAVDSIFPGYMLSTLHEILQEIYSSSSGLFIITLLTTLWAASNATYTIKVGLDIICDTYKLRSWIVARLYSLLYTFAMVILIVCGLASTVYFQSFRRSMIAYRPKGISLSMYSNCIKAFYTITLLTLAFAVMYKIFPHRKLRFVAQLPGALVASVGWYASSTLLSFYVTNFNATSMYGSLTTLALVMFWLYFCNLFIMFGAEVNEVLRLHETSELHEKIADIDREIAEAAVSDKQKEK